MPLEQRAPLEVLGSKLTKQTKSKTRTRLTVRLPSTTLDDASALMFLLQKPFRQMYNVA